VPGLALGLAGQDGGQVPVGPAALRCGRRLDYRGADERVPERHRARVLTDLYQVVALGRARSSSR